LKNPGLNLFFTGKKYFKIFIINTSIKTPGKLVENLICPGKITRNMYF